MCSYAAECWAPIANYRKQKKNVRCWCLIGSALIRRVSVIRRQLLAKRRKYQYVQGKNKTGTSNKWEKSKYSFIELRFAFISDIVLQHFFIAIWTFSHNAIRYSAGVVVVCYSFTSSIFLSGLSSVNIASLEFRNRRWLQRTVLRRKPSAELSCGRTSDSNKP